MKKLFLTFTIKLDQSNLFLPMRCNSEDVEFSQNNQQNFFKSGYKKYKQNLFPTCPVIFDQNRSSLHLRFKNEQFSKTN